MRSPALFLLTLSATVVFGCDSGIVDPTVAGDGGLAAKGGGSGLTAPSNATAILASDTRIDVSWQDNSSNETGFEVHRSTAGAAGSFTLLVTVAAGAILHADQELASGTEYCYRTRAIRVTGSKLSHSSFSNTACARTTIAPPPPAAPEAPSNLVAVSTLEFQIDLTWRDESSSETSFQISRSLNGEAGPFQHLTSKPADSEAHSDMWAYQPIGTLYCYYVVAVRENTTDNGTTYANSERSNVACSTAVHPPPPTAPPQSPYIVGAKPASSSVVTVTATWDDTSAAPAARFYRSLNAGATWELASLYQGMDLSVPSERSVCYRAVAYNEAGDGPPSNAACVTPPAGPTNLVATPIDATTLELTWTDNSAFESGYEVWAVDRWSSDCFSAGYSEWEGLVATLPPNTTSWRTGRMAYSCNQSGVYYIVAIRDGGRSDPSNEVSVTDPAP